MKLTLKKIYLKEETERDIESNIYDINKFIDYIKEHLKKANFLIENKILDLDEQELYDALKEVFDIKYDEEDYLEILSKKYEKHYTKIITLGTDMIDDEGYNISYLGAAIKDFKEYSPNYKLNLGELNNITKSYDFIILKKNKHKLNYELKPQERYTDLPQMNFNQNLDENNELFDKVLDLVRKTIKDKKVLKQVLSDLQKYINELMYQAKTITKLSESDNPQVRQIGKEYKKAFEENFNKKQLTQKNNHKRRY